MLAAIFLFVVWLIADVGAVKVATTDSAEVLAATQRLSVAPRPYLSPGPLALYIAKHCDDKGCNNNNNNSERNGEDQQQRELPGLLQEENSGSVDIAAAAEGSDPQWISHHNQSTDIFRVLAAVSIFLVVAAVLYFGDPLSSRMMRGGADSEVSSSASSSSIYSSMSSSGASLAASPTASGAGAADSGGGLAEPDRLWLIALLCCCGAVEGADIALLPSSLFALQADLGLRPDELACMALWQGLLQVLMAPLWGILADRGILTRRSILTIGCAGWGVATVLLGLISSWIPMLLLRACNGMMLACLRPISNGLVPDIVPSDRRGQIYGWIQISLDFGALFGSLATTPLSGMVIHNIYGWRLAFMVVGTSSLVLSSLVWTTMKEPLTHSAVPSKEGDQPLLEEMRRLVGYLRTPTFSLLVLQGVFGSVPWNALGYLPLYLQTSGLTASRAAVVTALGQASQGFGHLLGGCLGDVAARLSPARGRVVVAQISVFCGIPLLWLFFVGFPPGPENFAGYCVAISLYGLTSTWCGAGVNWPIFTEIVPAEGRSAVVAWDTALEGVSGAVLGNVMVAGLAEWRFGYRLSDAANMATAGNARALGEALACTTLAPFIICFVIYSALHWSYPHDAQIAAGRSKHATEACKEQ